MIRFFTLLIVSISFLVASEAQLYAGHIIGGDMTYRCVAPGRYAVALTVYIDCNCVNCAQFDPISDFGIYACGGESNVPCIFLDQSSSLQSLSIEVLDRGLVLPPEYECLENPPDLCVRRGVYTFIVDDLPPRDESIFIVWQRCCRNETINNIFDPGGTGATFFVEITPEAQRVCNSAASFNEFPPTVICADAPFEFDHSASDMDGDSLSYRFCAPLDGAGRDGGPDRPGLNPNTCTGIIPTPGCPPPYDPVLYVPPYSFNNPLLGNPQVRIDEETGIITGTPNVIGQFVVGVCVDEFREGDLINTTRRDFQFNTASCDVQIFAGIQAEEVLDDQQFYLRSCGDNEITFVNESGQRRFISEYLWEFPGAEPEISNDIDPTIVFPDTGQYVGKLVLNRGLPCADSADIIIDIFPEIRAEFEFLYDTCISGDVEFTDLSFTGSGEFVSWEWDFKDGNFGSDQNPLHLYDIPGLFDVSLKVTDINGCEDEYIGPVSYFPVPEEVIVGPDRAEACEPAPINFFNLSKPIDSTYTVEWDFGDGNVGEGIETFHIYEEPGNYTVKVDITSPIGCEASETFEGLVDILPSPRADFDFSPKAISHFNKTVNFTDQSEGPVFWEWDFGGEGGTFVQNPSFTFPDTGVYEVQLIVTHQSGCRDTISQIIDVVPEVRYFLPNAFSPNEDGLNDEFKGTGSFQYMDNFTMTVWNRWGELVFKTRDPNSGWNGRVNNQGKLAPVGVYVVLIEYEDARGNKSEIKGFATLVL